MSWDVVVVGAGPNGLTAAALMARAGRRVLVLEAAATIGGGARTDEALGAGLLRDVCSVVHPTGYVSPAFADLGLTDRGLEWLVPEYSFVHGFGPDRALGLAVDERVRAAELGRAAAPWQRMIGWVADAPGLVDDVFALPAPPRRPVATARFGALAGLPAATLVRGLRTGEARTAFAGAAAHAPRPLTAPASSAAGLLLAGLAGRGWPVARGGSQTISDALASIVLENGGRIETDCTVTEFADLPGGAQLFFDTSPRAFAKILGDRLPDRYRRRLERFRYASGTCKVDFVLREPIPWRDPRFARTATFHLAEDVGQIARAEADAAAGRLPARPWILGGEPTRIDPSRGGHLAWAYCHVPAGSDVDVADRIVAEIERCAPGFREVIAGQMVTTARQQERYNANNVGGDVGAGATSLRQLIARPVLRTTPQAVLPGVYLCSAATAPGGGVHGMSGYRAARHALSVS